MDLGLKKKKIEKGGNAGGKEETGLKFWTCFGFTR